MLHLPGGVHQACDDPLWAQLLSRLHHKPLGNLRRFIEMSIVQREIRCEADASGQLGACRDGHRRQGSCSGKSMSTRPA